MANPWDGTSYTTAGQAFRRPLQPGATGSSGVDPGRMAPPPPPPDQSSQTGQKMPMPGNQYPPGNPFDSPAYRPGGGNYVPGGGAAPSGIGMDLQDQANAAGSSTGLQTLLGFGQPPQQGQPLPDWTGGGDEPWSRGNPGPNEPRIRPNWGGGGGSGGGNWSQGNPGPDEPLMRPNFGQAGGTANPPGLANLMGGGGPGGGPSGGPSTAWQMYKQLNPSNWKSVKQNYMASNPGGDWRANKNNIAFGQMQGGQQTLPAPAPQPPPRQQGGFW